jgi:hypothetical protein
MVSRRRTGNTLADLTPLLINRDDRVAALVRVDPNSHHVRCVSFTRRGDNAGPVGGHIPVGAMHAPLKPRRPVRPRPAGRITDTSHEGT